MWERKRGQAILSNVSRVIQFLLWVGQNNAVRFFWPKLNKNSPIFEVKKIF